MTPNLTVLKTLTAPIITYHYESTSKPFIKRRNIFGKNFVTRSVHFKYREQTSRIEKLKAEIEKQKAKLEEAESEKK